MLITFLADWLGVTASIQHPRVSAEDAAAGVGSCSAGACFAHWNQLLDDSLLAALDQHYCVTHDAQQTVSPSMFRLCDVDHLADIWREDTAKDMRAQIFAAGVSAVWLGGCFSDELERVVRGCRLCLQHWPAHVLHAYDNAESSHMPVCAGGAVYAHCKLPPLPMKPWLRYLLVRKRVTQALRPAQSIAARLAAFPPSHLPFWIDPSLAAAAPARNDASNGHWPAINQKYDTHGMDVYWPRRRHVEMRSAYFGAPVVTRQLPAHPAITCSYNHNSNASAARAAASTGLQSVSVDRLMRSQGGGTLAPVLQDMLIWASLVYACAPDQTLDHV